MFKKILGLVIVAAFFLGAPAFATEGSVTQVLTYAKNGATVTGITESIATKGDLYVLTLTCIGDVGDGSIPNTDLVMTYIKGLYLYQVRAYPTPGGTAPDAADVFILDAAGEDYLGSADCGTTANKGANLIHATLPKSTMPYSYNMSSWYFFPIINTLTLKVANQATHSADYTIEIVFVR